MSDKTLCENCGEWVDCDSTGTPWNHTCALALEPATPDTSAIREAALPSPQEVVDAMKDAAAVATKAREAALEDAVVAVREFFSNIYDEDEWHMTDLVDAIREMKGAADV